MKQIFIYNILLIAVLLSSCSNKSNQLLESTYANYVSLEKKEINIPIDEKTLNTYQIHFIYQNNEKTLYAYNHLLHAIDIFDLNNKNVSHIQLNTEGNNPILKNISGMYVHQKDSIWLYSQGLLYLINNKGYINKKVTLPIPEGGFPMVDTNFSGCTSKLFYNKVRNSIFYLTVTPTEESANYLVYEYSINTNSIKIHPLPVTNLEAKVGKNFGWKQFPNVTYSEKYILYNFPINSNIYKINLETNKKYSFGGKSKYTSNLVNELCMPYSFQEADKHIIENVHFYELLYNPVKNTYYRLHFDKTNYSTDEKFDVMYDSKDIYLTIWDEDFNIIYEDKLKNKNYNHLNSWFVTNEGIAITKENTQIKESDIFALDLLSTK